MGVAGFNRCRRPGVRERQLGVAQGVLWINCDRLLEEIDRRLHVWHRLFLITTLIETGHSSDVGLVRSRGGRVFVVEPTLLARVEVNLQRGRNLSGYFVLNGKHIRRGQVKTVSIERS